jgi:hypothetical protein
MCHQRFMRVPFVPYLAPLTQGESEQAWYLGEGYSFRARARRCGFRVMADITIRLWHVGTSRYSWEDTGR